MINHRLDTRECGEIHVPLEDETDRRFAVTLTTGSRSSLLAEIGQCMRAGSGFAAATLNLDHVVKLRRSASFRRAYAGHSHVVADGNPIVWLARIAGGQVELTPGSDLVEPLAVLAAQNGVPLGLCGGTETSLDRAARHLLHHVPNLEIGECIAPDFGFDPQGEEANRLIEQMARSSVRIWLLALGAPKQEIFAARARDRLPDRGFVSIGAGLDFIAGNQTRAPKIMRVLTVEWLWRLAGNPIRFVPRYAQCIAILPGLTGAAWKQRWGPGAHDQRDQAGKA